MAGWKNAAMNDKDVFPIDLRDFPACHVSFGPGVSDCIWNFRLKNAMAAPT